MTEKVAKPPRDPMALAEFWRVTRRTLTNWANMMPPAPVRDVAKMIDWAAQQKRLSSACRSRIEELRSGKTATTEGTANSSDWEEFTKLTKAGDGDDPKAALAAIAKARDFASFKFEKASQAGDRDGMKFYSDLLVKFEGAIHDAQLRAKKLGLDAGELMPRAEFERLLRAWAFWAMKSIDVDLADLCKNLTGLAQVNDARAVLEPALLSARFVKPFARAARVESKSTLPAWVGETMKDAVDDYIENGAKEFEEAKI